MKYQVGDDDPTPDLYQGELCDAQSPEGLLCTWPRGHLDDHVAGAGGQDERAYVVGVWPNDEKQ